MNEAVVDGKVDIALQAEIELWVEIRKETRRKLTWSASVGTFYMLCSFAVGAFLLRAIGEVFVESDDLLDWSNESINLAWTEQLAWGYDLAFKSVAVMYVATLLAIHSWLPRLLCPIADWVPGVGGTLKAVSLGELCQSMYLSVLQSLPYGVALDCASKDVNSPVLRRWSSDWSKRVASGQSISPALDELPIIDHPVLAVAALTSNATSESATIATWRLAALDCHRLAQSRMERSTQTISVVCIAVSALSASMTLSISLYLLSISFTVWGF